MRSSAETADAIIIGGGVIGVSLAYYLAQRHFGRIVILERETLGGGSTGRSVASIDLFSFLPALLPLRVRSHAVFSHAAELLGQSCGFRQTGFAMLAGPVQADALRAAIPTVRAAAIDIHLLSPVEFAVLEPATQTEDLALIGYVPASGYGDPMLTLRAFTKAAERAGVIIEQNRPVIGLSRQGDKVVGVDTAAGSIAAPVVIIAAGPWSQRLLAEIDCDLGLWPCRHSVACLHRPADFGLPHVNFFDLNHQIYARPEPGELTLVGSLDPAVGYDPAEPEDDHGRDSADYSFWAVERLVQRYPALERGQVRPGWSGLLTVTPDWQPVLGALPQTAGVYCATGFSGHGFQISPAVGDLIAGLIAGEPKATELLAPFRPTRFAEGQPLEASEFGTLG